MNFKAQHVCFDKDGTLIDVHASWVPITRQRAQKIIDTFSLPKDVLSDLSRAMGVDLTTKKILPGGPVGYKPRAVILAAVKEWLKNLNINASTDDLADAFRSVDADIQKTNDFNAEALPGVIEGIKRLRRAGFKISVYTSDRHKNTEQVLKILGLVDHVDAIVGGDDVASPKPDPEGFLKACALVGVDKSHSIYVGDTVEDMMMAQKSGSLGGYSILQGLASRTELTHVSQMVFNTLTDLADSLTAQIHGKKTTPSV